MADYADHYFQPRLRYNDGRSIVGGKYRTIFDAMTEAERLTGVHGAVVYVGEPGDPPVDMIIYRPDGSIEVGPDVPDGEPD